MDTSDPNMRHRDIRRVGEVSMSVVGARVGSGGGYCWGGRLRVVNWFFNEKSAGVLLAACRRKCTTRKRPTQIYWLRRRYGGLGRGGWLPNSPVWTGTARRSWRVEEPLNFKILLWWLSSNSKQKSIYLALIYSLSLGGGSACQFRANACHKDSVRMWLRAQVTLKVFLRLWKVFLRLWRFSQIERFKVNKKVQRFKVTIWFLRRKVQS